MHSIPVNKDLGRLAYMSCLQWFPKVLRIKYIFVFIMSPWVSKNSCTRWVPGCTHHLISHVCVVCGRHCYCFGWTIRKLQEVREVGFRSPWSSSAYPQWANRTLVQGATPRIALGLTTVSIHMRSIPSYAKRMTPIYCHFAPSIPQIRFLGAAPFYLP